MLLKMKKTFRFSAILIAALVAFSACQNKDTAKADLENLLEDVRTNGDNYTIEDWGKFLNDYHKTDSIIGTYAYTDEERKEINKTKLKCAPYLLKGAAKVTGGEIKEAIDGLIGD